MRNPLRLSFRHVSQHISQHISRRLLHVTLAGLAAAVLGAAVARVDLHAQTPPAQAAAVNISGEWVVYLTTPNAAPWRGALEQQGAKIVGYMGNETAEYPVTGTIDGTQVKFSWSLYEAGEKVDIRITGKFDREAITGTATIGTVADVEVSAQRTSR